MGDSRINWRHASTVISAAILVGTEVFVGAVAGSWAVANLFGFSHVGTFILMLIGVALASLALANFLRKATKTEPIFRR
jgi:type III secretory pathway component EscT